ncbi:hypothetical protein PTKIN_Ptkin14bG0064200 [Pterospermum kingtungense]
MPASLVVNSPLAVMPMTWDQISLSLGTVCVSVHLWVLWRRLLWEIYFQSMVMDGINMAEEKALGGEIEIERIPTVDSNSNSNSNGRLLHQRSGMSENGGLFHRSSCGSLDSENGAGVAEFRSGIEENILNVHQMPIGTKGFVS